MRFRIRSDVQLDQVAECHHRGLHCSGTLNDGSSNAARLRMHCAKHCTSRCAYVQERGQRNAKAAGVAHPAERVAGAHGAADRGARAPRAGGAAPDEGAHCCYDCGRLKCMRWCTILGWSCYNVSRCAHCASSCCAMWSSPRASCCTTRLQTD